MPSWQIPISCTHTVIAVKDVIFLTSKWTILAPNGTNFVLFKINFLFILTPLAKMDRKKCFKSPTFGATLAQSEAKSDSPDCWLSGKVKVKGHDLDSHVNSTEVNSEFVYKLHLVTGVFTHVETDDSSRIDRCVQRVSSAQFKYFSTYSGWCCLEHS